MLYRIIADELIAWFAQCGGIVAPEWCRLFELRTDVVPMKMGQVCCGYFAGSAAVATLIWPTSHNVTRIAVQAI